MLVKETAKQMKRLTEFVRRRRKFLLTLGALPLLAVLLLAAVMICSAGPYRPVEPLPHGIIDMHCHVAGIGKGSDCFVSPRLRDSWKFRVYLRSFGVSKKELLQ